jgi:ribonuclease Z
VSISYKILGQPGRDNALYVEVNTGQSIHRLQFDCGEGCLRDLPIAQIQAIDALLFSHFHIDHVAGFDSFLRSTYDRADRPVDIWGPAVATEIIHHRLQGVTWNLVEDEPGEFVVTDIHADRLVSSEFLARERFVTAHSCGERSFTGTVIDHADFSVVACLMDHGTPSVAYCVREKPRSNIDTAALAQLGLGPGAWLKQVKDPTADPQMEIQIQERRFRVGDLRDQLLRTTPGESIAYLTDFRLTTESEDKLVEMLAGCMTIVCENNFRNAELPSAERTFHMVSSDVARLAASVKPQKLFLFHLSDRYTPAEWQEQLEEVRVVFPETYFPDSWKITILPNENVAGLE